MKSFQVLRQLSGRAYVLALLSFWLAAAANAEPAPVGVVTFATGTARVTASGDHKPTVVELKRGDALYAGQIIETGDASLVHVRLIDDAYLSVRPKSRLVIEAYEFDSAAPLGSKVKYKLENGIARSITGKAGQANKAGFRFNTPVAAIGIRGTDFVVQTTPEVTRAAINSGRIVMSGFGPHCSPDALGPCGNGVAELSRRTSLLNEQYLEVRANQVSPTLVPAQPGSGSLMPKRTMVADVGSVPTLSIAEAPATGVDTRATNVDTRASASAVDVVAATVVREVTAAAEPPVVIPPIPPIPPKIFWGRWSAYEGGQPERALADAMLEQPWATLAVVNTGFALFRDSGTMNMPETGRFAFRLADSEAYIQSGLQLSAAQVGNANLDIDFSNRSFQTGFTLSSANLPAAQQFEASGSVRSNGTFFNGPAANMDVRGSLSSDASQAGYVFRSPLPGGQIAVGATRWQR